MDNAVVKGSTSIDSTPVQRRDFALAKPGIRMAPSVLSADFARLAEEVAGVEAAGAEVLHLDVMDGHFAPNISFGVPVIAALRKCTKLFLDAHLMISEPKRYAEAFIKAGCDHITFHIEAVDPRDSARADADGPQSVVKHIRSLGASVGVALNPTTPVSAIEPILDSVDMVLVMSVWPGFSGQKFIAAVLPKVEELRGKLAEHQRLEIDGGIDEKTIAQAAEAGADTFVVGSAVFGTPDPPAAMKRLHHLALESAGRRGGA
jgi:ribulose-phosphate 3-epimerase